MNSTYRSRLRPAYGSSKLLLEFIPDHSDTKFLKDLMTAIADIHPKFDSIQDLWMNDEVIFTIDSDHGQFLLSKDTWDFAFIMAEDNQSCVLIIDKILSANSLFKKEEVDFSDYTLKN